MAIRKKYAGTNDDLTAHALEPTMRWLIAVALDGSDITYGEVKRRLVAEAGFSSIFTTRIGFVAGALMGKIQAIEPKAPLINVLVVGQGDREPSEGAGSFMANRFGEKRLDHSQAKELHPRLWTQTFKRAAGEVYQVTADEWSNLFERVFNKSLDAESIDNLRKNRKKGAEEDGIPIGRNYGRGGEGPFHRELRLWVRDNPSLVHRTFTNVNADTEVDLDSGDRIDVVYKAPDRTIVIEVKSRISNDVDFRRGVFQCIKYRAVREAMDVRDDPVVEAYLVTETKLPGEIAKLLKLHDIRHYQAPLDRN